MNASNKNSRPTEFNAAVPRKWLENIHKLAWPNGAELSCSVCLRRSKKTPEQMEQYLKKWPKCNGSKESPHKPTAASVKPL